MAKHKNPNTFQKFFRDIFTGRDNRTYDMGRVLWFQSVQAFVLVTIYSLHKGGSFDPVTWGAGLAALIAGGGAAIGIKASTEPNDANGDGKPDDYLDQVTAAQAKAAALRNTVQVNVNGTTSDGPQSN
jgi:hypothetical protein